MHSCSRVSELPESHVNELEHLLFDRESVVRNDVRWSSVGGIDEGNDLRLLVVRIVQVLDLVHLSLCHENTVTTCERREQQVVVIIIITAKGLNMHHRG